MMVITGGAVGSIPTVGTRRRWGSNLRHLRADGGDRTYGTSA